MSKPVIRSILGLVLLCSSAFAQDEGRRPGSSDFGQLAVSGYVHVQWLSDYRPAVYPRHSFELRRIRLRFKYIPSDIGANVELGCDDLEPSVEETYIQYRVSQVLGFAAGLEKMPFSREELTSSSKLIAIERGLTNDRFGDRGYLGRDIGFAVEGELAGLRLGYAAGVFNGNGARLSRDDNNAKQFVERVTFGPAEWLEFGLSGTQRNDSVTGQLVHAYGLDFGCPLRRLRLEGEVLVGNQEQVDWMLGAWLAGAYRLGAFEPVAKLERFHPNLTTDAAAETEVTFGCNWYPHRRVQLKANVVGDFEALTERAVVAQAQVSF